MIHEFRLSRRGSGGVFCDEGGAFVGAVPMLARTRRNGKDEWRPRDCDDLSKEMSAQYGLPVDMSSKRGGLTAIAKALNEGDVVRAQVATVLLGVPDPPSLSKGAPSREEMIKSRAISTRAGCSKPIGTLTSTRVGLPAHLTAKADNSPRKAPIPRPTNPAAGRRNRRASCDARDVGISDRQPHDFRAPSNSQSTPQDNNGGDDGGRSGPEAEGRGVYARYGRHIGGVQVADASILWDGLGIIEANPADWANVARLANGALRLGSGLIITAPALLTATDAYGERADVNDAISKI